MSSTSNKSGPVRAYLDEQIKKMRSALALGDKDLKPDVIHKARVASRRMKAALDLIEPIVKPAAFCEMRHASKKLRKRLGKIREIDVMLKLLSPMAKRDHCAAQLAESFSEERKCLLRDFPKKERRALRKAITLDAKAKKELAIAEPATMALAREGILKEFDAVRESAGLAATEEAATNLHQLRIAAKRFRYGLELAEAAGFKSAGRAAGHFKRIQDALGVWHDEVVFAHAITTFAGQSRVFEAQPTDAARMLALAAARMAKSEVALARFRATWRKVGEGLISAVQQMAETPASAASEES
jgi:CHAD domain-containing protein